MIDMGMECKYGQMGQNMKGIGSIIKLKERGLFGMQKEMYMREILKMIKRMGMECTHM